MDNFDFLKETDKELFSIIEDSQKLFRDGYFNQSSVQARIFAEKLAKKIYGTQSKEMTFDDVLNCLKDKIKTTRDSEFIEDLFFIKKQGNACAHGEDCKPTDALEAIKRAFEVALSYVYLKTKDEEINKLQFDETLLITQKPKDEVKLIDKYLSLAQEEINQKEALLNQKQGEFNQAPKEKEDGLKDRNFIENTSKYKKSAKEAKKPRKKKEPTEKQKQIKEKIKQTRKNLKENINKPERKQKKKPTKKELKSLETQKKKQRKIILFLIFTIISLYFLTKMIFFF